MSKAAASREPSGEVPFTYDRSHYTMVFDMAAIAFFEREADCSIIDMMAAIAEAEAAGKAPKVSHLALLMQAGLRRFHPEVDLDRAARMLRDDAVRATMWDGFGAAMPGGDDADGDEAVSAGGNARAGTGTGRSKRRSKPASR